MENFENSSSEKTITLNEEDRAHLAELYEKMYEEHNVKDFILERTASDISIENEEYSLKQLVRNIAVERILTLLIKNSIIEANVPIEFLFTDEQLNKLKERNVDTSTVVSDAMVKVKEILSKIENRDFVDVMETIDIEEELEGKIDVKNISPKVRQIFSSYMYEIPEFDHKSLSQEVKDFLHPIPEFKMLKKDELILAFSMYIHGIDTLGDMEQEEPLSVSDLVDGLMDMHERHFSMETKTYVAEQVLKALQRTIKENS